MNKRYLLAFRSAQGDMTFSCVVRAEGGDELKCEIERRAWRLSDNYKKGGQFYGLEEPVKEDSDGE